MISLHFRLLRRERICATGGQKLEALKFDCGTTTSGVKWPICQFVNLSTYQLINLSTQHSSHNRIETHGLKDWQLALKVLRKWPLSVVQVLSTRTIGKVLKNRRLRRRCLFDRIINRRPIRAHSRPMQMRGRFHCMQIKW